MKILFTNIKQLVQIRSVDVSYVSGADMSVLPCLEDAYLMVENGMISDYGLMTDCKIKEANEVINCTNRSILPTWCDSHTHLVYAGSRVNEFVDRINGLSYQEIANRGGGILNSAKLLREIPDDILLSQSSARLDQVTQLGTGAIEIKSGYGLNVAGELKMLRTIRKLKESFDIPIVSTFLGAHAIPTEYYENKDGYLALLIDDLLPIVAKEGLADYIDIFCEKGYFSVSHMETLLIAAKQYNIKGKVHVNQFNSIGGVEMAVRHSARSVDHLEIMTASDINALVGSKTMPVALPGCSYFLSIPYTPAREMIDAGLPLAIATDYNPGSAPSGNMNFVVSAACIKMKMTPEEAINAATINGAYAMGLEREVGSITIGKRANLIVTKQIESYSDIPYSFGANCIESVYLSGKEVL